MNACTHDLPRRDDRPPARRAALAAVAAGLATLAAPALAHVGDVNTQLPFAREATYELVLAIPHGCVISAGSSVEADTYKVEVTTPAGFTGPRAIIDGVFGVPTRTENPNGTVTFVWTKPANFDSAQLADNQSYRIGLRGTFRATTPDAAGTRFTSQPFNARQFCKNPASPNDPAADLVVDWANYGSPASNQSPVVRVLPTRTPGWNAYTLPSAVAATLTSPTAVAAFVRAYFADAQMVWVGKAGFSPNAATTTRIQALITKDGSYSELINKGSLSSTETLWVKY